MASLTSYCQHDSRLGQKLEDDSLQYILADIVFESNGVGFDDFATQSTTWFLIAMALTCLLSWSSAGRELRSRAQTVGAWSSKGRRRVVSPRSCLSGQGVLGLLVLVTVVKG